MSDVAVVIPSWNGEALLPACLESLRRQSLPPAEVLVVDNGSNDASLALLDRSFPEVRAISLATNRGFAAAVNAGIRATSTEYVALLNNDAEAEPRWLAALVAAAERERAGMVASKILDADDPNRIEGIGLEVDGDGNPRQIGRGEPDGPPFAAARNVFGPIGAAALYRRDLFEDVGVFDEDFFAYLEDVDLAWRARRAGWCCIYEPDAVVRHRRASTGRRIPRRVRYLLWRNHAWLLAKNADRGTLMQFAMRQPFRDLAEILRFIARGHPLDALLLACARLTALVRIPRMLKRRRVVGRLASEGGGQPMNRDLSVVVVSWNTRDALARCLESVATDPIGARAEVWVVDNNSSDGSSEMVRHRFPRARLIENHTNRGFAAACNQALAQVTAPVVLLLNSDATLERGALDHLIDVLDRRPEVAVVGGLLIGPDGQPRRSYGEVPTVGAFIAEMLGAGSVPLLRRLVPAVASPPRRREGARVVGYVVGACLVFRRELLDLVGPLDERFFLYFEEADFCLRVRNETGRLVWFEPAARVRHEGQASARQLGTQAEALYARSAYAFVRKHFGARSARRLSIAFRAWLAAQAAVHRVGALAGRPGSADALARKQRLRGLHRELGRGQEWGWAA